MPPDRNDPEIRDFIAASSAGTYREMADLIAARFGEARRWPPELIFAVHEEIYRSGSGRKSPLNRNPAMRRFIADRAGLMSLSEIVRLGRLEFGSQEFPSRSAVGRFVVKLRQEAARTAARG